LVTLSQWLQTEQAAPAAFLKQPLSSAAAPAFPTGVAAAGFLPDQPNQPAPAVAAAGDLFLFTFVCVNKKTFFKN